MIIDDNLFDGLLAEAGENPRLRINMDLRNSGEDGSQRMLNALLPGTAVPIHRHWESSETTVILRGRLFVVFYDDLGGQTARFLLDPSLGNYGVQIPRGQWHSVEVVEPSVILERKEGRDAPLGPEDTMD